MEIVSRVVAKVEAFNRQRSPALREPADVAKISQESLLFYYGDMHSQRGQDGILAEIFRRLRITTGQFVEFGAWDGIYLSNSRFLFEKGWSGVFIEGDARKFRDLQARYAGTGIECVNAMVEPGGLPRLIRNPDDVTFVSIDVDGIDLEIFEGMGLLPAVVLVEGGFNFAPNLTTRLIDHRMQQPLSVICSSAIEHGYTPVCFYQDTYLVRSDLASGFRQANAVTLFSEAFYFMPVRYRESLIALRAESAFIQERERSFFGVFHADPLAYL